MPYDYRQERIKQGYFFECSHVDCHTDLESAIGCGKCARVLDDEDYNNREVIDLRTGKVVWKEL